MNFKKIGQQLISKGVPSLGNLFFGSAGEKVGEFVANALGCEVEEIPDKIESEENILKLKELELNHKTEIESLQLETLKTELKDVQSARQREIDKTRITGKSDINLYILAWIVVLGFFGLLIVLMQTSLPEGATGYINQLFGALSTGFGMVLQYFFGSSKSSSDKNKILGGKK